MLRCSPPQRVRNAVRIATGECEPVPHQAQDLNLTVVRAYKRSCNRVDSVIKFGRGLLFGHN
jgi:hypothetical protein